MTPDPGACYEVLNESDITDPYMVVKSIRGAVYDGCDVVGIVELKLGKVKKGASKVSGAVTTLDGKKHAIKAKSVRVEGGVPAMAVLPVKGFDPMVVTIGGRQFAGMMGDYHVQSAGVGEVWAKGSATAEVYFDDVSMFPGDVLQDLLPYSETATASGGKWTFAKAASIKMKKGTLVGTDDPAKPNKSGLKLSYTPKKGTFKGSFKVYELQGAKLKKYTVKVNGVVVDGVGYGMATCKKPAASWSVMVK